MIDAFSVKAKHECSTHSGKHLSTWNTSIHARPTGRNSYLVATSPRTNEISQDIIRKREVWVLDSFVADRNIGTGSFSTWIARFGVSAKLNTDQGRQFDSELIKKMPAGLSIQKIRPALHSQSNGMVERWHRGLKAAIKTNENDDWVRILPLVLLGLRSAISEESGVLTAQLTYGARVRQPTEFFTLEKWVTSRWTWICTSVKRSHQKFSTKANKQHGKFPVYVPSSVASCQYVFVCVVEPQRGPLIQPYKGPYHVLEKSEQSFVIDVDGEKKRISIDRLKPAYLLREAASAKKKIQPPIQRKQPNRTVWFHDTYRVIVSVVSNI